MTLLAGALLGLIVAIVAFLAIHWTASRERSAVNALVSGVNGEERLRALEQSIQASMNDLRSAMQTIDLARGESLARLDGLVGTSQRTIEALQRSTQQLATTLSSSQARGQLGERLADDILRAAGFVEGVSYRRNSQIEGGLTRPDFTFFLPEGRCLHMDVKFPLASYVRSVECEEDGERVVAERQFLLDVRSTIRSVATREYVDPSHGTLAFMLVFVPNEQIFSFVNERDSSLADDARQLGVVLCSPLSLFALLSVVKQAADSFALASDANEVLQALSGFARQWDKYQEYIEKISKRLDSLQTAFEELRGPRTRALNKQLARVDELRAQRHLELPAMESDDPIPDDKDEVPIIPSIATLSSPTSVRRLAPS